MPSLQDRLSCTSTKQRNQPSISALLAHLPHVPGSWWASPRYMVFGLPFMLSMYIYLMDSSLNSFTDLSVLTNEYKLSFCSLHNLHQCNRGQFFILIYFPISPKYHVCKNSKSKTATHQWHMLISLHGPYHRVQEKSLKPVWIWHMKFSHLINIGRIIIFSSSLYYIPIWNKSTTFYLLTF